ncbi:MAG: DNA polymerase II, partial [Candidatus Methanofastidiosa archaeon]|nr:DNA polymerase II [Candidatus Methanofastidiosa archaeon]
ARKLTGFKSEETDMRNFEGEGVTKIVVGQPSEVRTIRELFEKNDIECFESDIKFENRFLMDNGIKGYIGIEGDSYGTKRIDKVFINPKVRAVQDDVDLRILSIDIETHERGFEDFSLPIYSVALYGEGLREVMMLEKCCENATSFPSEIELLKALEKRIIEFDPDVIVGWNIVDFDLVYLKKRFEANKMPFDICRSESEVSLLPQTSFIKASRAKVEGRMVLDAMYLLRDFFYKFEDYRLDTAGKVLVDEGKHVLDKSISELYQKDPSELSKYNLKDAYLVYRIVEKENLVKLAMTLSSITGMMMDRVKASIATLDSLYIRKAIAKGIVCPSVKGEKRIAVVGGFVEEPLYGIYDNVILCDFRSLYPSIIATFNIDPLTYDKGDICAPNNVCFGGGDSILPEIILELLEERRKAKKDGHYTKQFAIKIIMNSIFGVLGNPNCRFYNSSIANAVTSFGRHILVETSQKIESWGYKVIYGDTDSVFVVSNTDDAGRSAQIGKEIESRVNEFYRSYVKEKYGRESYIILEFEKVFEKFFLPRQRHLEKGAKKRYAGMVDGELQIIGLEYVRRDWTQLAKEFQFNLLTKLFKGEDYEDYIRRYVKDIYSGKLNDKLVYRKKLRKDIEKYTKTTPPHVKAARMLDHQGKEDASLIEYVITKKGPQPLSIARNIDYNHYVDKQIMPIAKSVLSLLDKRFEDVISGATQKTLMDFFT